MRTAKVKPTLQDTIAEPYDTIQAKLPAAIEHKAPTSVSPARRTKLTPKLSSAQKAIRNAERFKPIRSISAPGKSQDTGKVVASRQAKAPRVQPPQIMTGASVRQPQQTENLATDPALMSPSSTVPSSKDVKTAFANIAQV